MPEKTIEEYVEDIEKKYLTLNALCARLNKSMAAHVNYSEDLTKLVSLESAMFKAEQMSTYNNELDDEYVDEGEQQCQWNKSN